MTYVYDRLCGKTKVNSKVKVGKVGSARWRSYCARSAGIKGNWRKNNCSKNAIQRRRWKC